MQALQTKNQFGLAVARELADASDTEWVRIFRHLQRERRLLAAMHEINNLLADPECRPLAIAALRRMGFVFPS